MNDNNDTPQNFTLPQLAKYFDLPINEAAEKLGVCATVLKKVCRNNGVKRWPHRKIKSINGMIDSLQQLIDAKDGDLPSLNMDMDELLEKKKFLLENPNVSYKSVVSKYKIQKAQNGSPISPTSPKLKIPKPSKGIEKKPLHKLNQSQKVKMPQINQIDCNEANAVRILADLHAKESQSEAKKSDSFSAPSLKKSTDALANFVNSFAPSVQYSRVPLTRQFAATKPFFSLPPLRMSG